MWGQKPGFYSSLYVGFSGGLCEVAIFSMIAGGVRTAQRAFLMRGRGHRMWIVALQAQRAPVKTHYAV